MKAASSLVRNDNAADQILRHLDALDRLQACDGGEFLIREAGISGLDIWNKT
jgi:hypothetical protein